MFIEILKFEIKYWLRNVSMYIYLMAFFLMALGSMAGVAGVFGEGSSNIENIANSPLSIYNFTSFFLKLLLFLTPAIVGTTIYKDFKSKIHTILYTYPFTKKEYLAAKFVSSFIIVCLIAFSIILGLILGTKLPGANPLQMQDFSIIPYLQTYFIYVVPTLFFLSVVVFTVVSVTRNIFTGFISVILIWMIKEILQLFTDGDSFLGFLIDPFAGTVIQYFTRFWTLAEQNTLAIPLHSEVLYNRLFWLVVSGFILVLIYRWFSFSQTAISFTIPYANDRKDNYNESENISAAKAAKPEYIFSWFHWIKTTWKLSETDFLFIIRSGAFISIVIAGTIFVGAILLQINPQTDTKTLPLTWVILGFPVFFFSFLIQILSFLYAGILVHRARNNRFYDLVAVTAVPNWVLLFSKFLALLKMQLVLLILIAISGISVQVYSGHTQFEFFHYLFDLLFIHWVGFAIWAMIALLVHNIFNNTYLSLFLLIVLSLSISQLQSVGIEKFIFRLNESPNSDFYLRYTDMNLYGHALIPYLVYKFYWLVLGLLLCCLSLLVWERDITFSVSERISVAIKRMSGRLAFISVILLTSFVSLGYYLYRQEIKPENRIWSASDESALLNQFQHTFQHYKHILQPRITSVNVKMDIFPESNSFRASGTYTLINKTRQTLDTLLIKTGYDEITSLILPIKATIVSQDTNFKFSVYKLKKGIAPNDSLILQFTIRNKDNSFLIRHSGVLHNGTYIKSDVFPRLGYFANTDKKMPTDTNVLSNHYQSIDADVVLFEAVLSTIPEQTAITSGYLQKEWLKNGRRYFHYKMDTPIKFVIGFNSGRFDMVQEKYKDIDLKIYYHPSHKYNLKQLMEGMKASLDYNIANFGPYQHRQMQIIEFPRSEGSYATTSANCMQMSEIRFVNDTTHIKAGGIDLSFYVAAHEFSHQWWGNQVMPADALGASMITESVAEYISAKVYEKKYGKQNALKFLEIQRNRYLSGKSNETGKEQPLYLVDTEQSYISYGKGAIVLFTLSEYIGEKKLNEALKAYLIKTKFRGPPYTTSLEMLEFLKNATPPNKQYLISDMFETTSGDKTMSHFDHILGLNNASKKR